MNKNCLFCDFELLTYQNTKTHAKEFMRKQEIEYQQKCVFSVFLSLLGRETSKCMEIILYDEINDIIRNVYYDCF